MEIEEVEKSDKLFEAAALWVIGALTSVLIVGTGILTLTIAGYERENIFMIALVGISLTVFMIVLGKAILKAILWI